MKVVHEYTGDVVSAGDEVVSFRGEPATFVRVSKRPDAPSEGRVLVRWLGGQEVHYYPSVFGLKIVGN